MLSPATSIQENWVGPAYLPYLVSDNSTYKNVDQIRILGSLAVYAMNTGNAALYSKLRWMIDNLPPGGLSYRHTRITTAVSNSSLSMPIFYYLATDPNAVGADPRGAQPTDYFAPGTGFLLSRT